MHRAERGRAGQAVPRLLRARRDARAAPPDQGVDREVQGQVRPRLERGARADLRQPEAPRRDPAEREADRVAGQRAEVGHVQQGRAEDARPPGRGLRRLHGLCRSRDRARDPGGRGHGQARQHAGHLHRRRQRREPRGHHARHPERVRHLQQRRGPAEGPDEVLRRLGLRQDVPALRGRLGVGVRHAVQVDQAGRVALRRHPPGHGDLVAGAHQGRRAASATSSITSSTSCRRSSRRPASRRRTRSTACRSGRWMA